MFKIIRFTEVTSTNDIIKEQALCGAPEWTVVLADSQSAGRGRMGRSFMSPCGTGIYMSILLRPKFSADKSLLITTAAAAAVAKAIEKHTKKAAQIKWVNDIYQHGKKVCGILTEGKISGNMLEYAVLGIGINLEVPRGGFGELSDIAGALFENEEYDKDEICSDILQSFAEYYAKLEVAPHYSDYVRRDMLSGKDVDVIRQGEILFRAKVHGIAKDFSLIVEHDGVTEALSTGEVSVRVKNSN